MKKQTTIILITILAVAAAAMLSGCSSGTPGSSKNTTDNTQASSAETTVKSTNTAEDASAESAVSVKEGGYLAIPIAGLSQKASFYKAALGETEVEIVALKDSRGNLRTAFNACQVCYSSGKGYYRQNGNYLVCQNCGNSFTINQVGIASGGCNPWPILDSDRTVTSDEIQISYDVLKATADELPNFFPVKLMVKRIFAIEAGDFLDLLK